MSTRRRLWWSDGRLRAFRRSSYGLSFREGSSFIARWWIFSISLQSVFMCGAQIKFPYSMCGRSIVLNNVGMIVTSR